MKKLSIRIFFGTQLVLVTLFITAIFADPPAIPILSNSLASVGSIHVGDSAAGSPTGDILGIMLVLGIAIGCYKIFELWKNGA
jgi:hypothetical protein